MSTVKIKKRRKFISLKEKIHILDCLKNGERPSSIAKALDYNEATIRTIQKNEDKIRSTVLAGSPINARNVARTRPVIIEKMEKALMIWINDCNEKNIPLDSSGIKQMALNIYELLKRTNQPSSREKQPLPTFIASKGWFENLKKRFSLHNMRVLGEITSAVVESAKIFSLEFAKVVKNKGYAPDQIFNANEIELFWKKLPRRVYTSIHEENTKGPSEVDNKISLLLCSNASGDFVTEPLLINQSFNTPPLNECKSNSPVHWQANRNALMTSDIFKDWFYTCFIPNVGTYMKKKSLDFKILLILDSAPGHPKDLNYPNVEILFLPPNMTSQIQPLNQGVTPLLKTNYVRQMLEKILNDVHLDKNLTVVEAWKRFSVQDCAKIVSKCVKEIKKPALNACWKMLWPAAVAEENKVQIMENDHRQILAVARCIGREFKNLNIEDIQEMLEEHALNEEDLLEMLNEPIMISDTESDCSETSTSHLTLEIVREGMGLADELEQFFMENDPSMERSIKFKRDLHKCLAPYREIFKDLQAKSKQSNNLQFIESGNIGESSGDNLQTILKDGEINKIVQVVMDD